MMYDSKIFIEPMCRNLFFSSSILGVKDLQNKVDTGKKVEFEVSNTELKGLYQPTNILSYTHEPISFVSLLEYH